MDIDTLFDSRSNELFYYSPLNYIRSIDEQFHLNFVKEEIRLFDQRPHNYIYEFDSESGRVAFFYSFLEWDSTHFFVPTYKICYVLFPSQIAFADIEKGIQAFSSYLSEHGKFYCFYEVPSEDTILLQALCSSRFKLIETRLNFFYDNISGYTGERYPVREASINEAPFIAKIASEKRNNFDRIHADIFFTMDEADRYLGTYASNAVSGFCETVLVPDEAEYEAFLAIGSRLYNNEKFYQISLVTVGDKSKGWHIKLVSETIEYAKEKKANYLLMTTQSTNRAVFRTCEKLGFKLGSTTHILSIHN